VVNDPAADVVAVAAGVVSKSTLTVSPGPNPVPSTLTAVVGGPAAGFSVIAVVAVAPDTPAGMVMAVAGNTATAMAVAAPTKNKRFIGLPPRTPVGALDQSSA
jgi:hypothetical protein